MAHTSYLINLASPDDALWQKSIDAMIVEVERCEMLGIADLVRASRRPHGRGRGSGPGAGRPRPGRGPPPDRRAADVVIDLETTAGQGTCLGHRFEHLGAILDRVGAPGAAGRLRGYLPYFRRGLSLGHAGGVR